MKKTILLIIILLPFIVKAETIESITEKYYKTIEMIPVNKGIQSKDLSITNTYEVTEEEYNLGLEEPNRNNITVETTYKKMTVTISKVQSLYKYKVNLHWKNMPSTRSYDIIGLAYLGSVEPKVSPIFNQEYCYSNGNCTSSATHYAKSETNSVSALFALPTGSLTSLDQTLYVLVGKKSANTTIIYQKAVGDYAHATSNVSQSTAWNNYSMSISGISLDSSIIFDYDEISTAQATWSGTW